VLKAAGRRRLHSEELTVWFRTRSNKWAEDEKGQVRMLPVNTSSYAGSDLANSPKWCSKTSGRKVRKQGGRDEPGRSLWLAKEMLGTDGAWRALPRLQAFPKKLIVFKALSAERRGEDSRDGEGRDRQHQQPTPTAPTWLRHRRMEHGCVRRGSNIQSEKLMVRSQEQRGRGSKVGWPEYKGVDTNRPDYMKINGREFNDCLQWLSENILSDIGLGN